MAITQLYADLRTAIGRGSSVDANLPGWCQEAISELERDAFYKWMEKTATVSASPGPAGNILSIPNVQIAAVDFVRTVRSQGTNGSNYGPALAPCTAFDILSVDEGMDAQGFYFDGVSNIVLDAIPGAATDFQIRYWEYTQWPTDVGETPPILARHYAGTKAIAMMAAARNLRDARLAEVWNVAFTSAKQGMWIADGIDGRSGMKHRRGMAQRGQ